MSVLLRTMANWCCKTMELARKTYCSVRLLGVVYFLCCSLQIDEYIFITDSITEDKINEGNVRLLFQHCEVVETYTILLLI